MRWRIIDLFSLVVNVFTICNMSEFISELFGEKLVGKEGDKTAQEALSNKQFIGVYFSAHWCPPCRGFTPVLAAFYDELQEDKEDALEIVFVSSDSSEEEFQGYYKTMPWLALPLNSNKKDYLSSKFGVRGIPMLIILDGVTGEIKSVNGRADVTSNKTDHNKCLTMWKENDVMEAGAGGGGSSCLIL